MHFKHAFISSDRLDIVMELCEEGDLFSLIAARKSLSEAEAAFATGQLLHGLGHLHEHGIVHRDMKPENVLVKRIPPAGCGSGDSSWQAKPCTFDLSSTTRGRYVIKITDFGFSHAIGEPLLVQSLVGTLAYLPPEVPLRGDYSPKSDVWAVGVILYIMLCGYPPFWGTDSDMWRNIKAARWVMHDKYWGGISADAKSLVSTLMAKEPVKRPACAEALRHTFLASTQSNAELPAGTMRSLRRLNARRRLRAAVMAVMWGQRVHRFRLQQLRACLPQQGTLSDTQLKGIVAHFNAATCGTGTADAAGLQAALSAVGLPVVPVSVFGAFDADGDGRVDVKEFVVALSLLCAQGEAAAALAFDIFDSNGDGQLSRDEVTALVQATAGPHMAHGLAGDTLVSALMSALDKNGDGVVTRGEFLGGLTQHAWIRDRLLVPLKLAEVPNPKIDGASGVPGHFGVPAASASSSGPLLRDLSAAASTSGSAGTLEGQGGGVGERVAMSTRSGLFSDRVGGTKRSAADAGSASDGGATKLRRQQTGGGTESSGSIVRKSSARTSSSMRSSCCIQ